MRKPSAGGTPTAIASRLRSVRYAVGDVLFVVGRGLARAGRLLIRFPRAVVYGIGGFWHSLSVFARRRLVAAVAFAAVVLAFLAFAVPNLPCGFPGGDSCPPADDAEALVPADSLAYVHANLDPDTDQYEAAAGLVGKLPSIGSQIVERAEALVPGPEGGSLDFDRDVRPWFGGEVAAAIIAGPGAIPARVDLLESEDDQAAAEYASSLAVGDVQTTEYEGVEVSTDRKDVSTAVVGGFLVIGNRDGVESVIATATSADGTDPLADDPAAREVRDELPDHRLAEAWVSPDGVSDLIAGGEGSLSTLTPLVAPGATRGAAAALSASDDGFELAVRSALDAERAEASPSFFAAFPAFEPGLTERLAAKTLAYLGIGAPSETVGDLLTQASAQAPRIAEGFEKLVDRLRRRGDVDIESDLLGALGDEAALALQPAPEQGAIELGGVLPYAQFVADGVDEDEARSALAALQAPLAEAVGVGEEGQTPVFGQQEVDGVELSTLRVSPTVQLTYAVFDGLAAIATDPAGVTELIEGDGSLGDEELYERATDDFPGEVSFLAYLDLGGLIAIGEQAGLAEDPLYATFAGDFRRLRALGVAITEDEGLLATDMRLLIDEPEQGEDARPAVPELDD